MNCANGELTGLRGRFEQCARLYSIPSGARGGGQRCDCSIKYCLLMCVFIDKIDNKLLMIPIDFSLHFFFKN